MTTDMAPPLARQPWSIVANLGGPVDPQDHIGHEDELSEAFRAAGSVGALFLGDRRMGKTSLLKTFIARLDGEHVVLFLSAETDSPELFGQRLLDALRGHHPFAEEIDRWSMDVDVSYRGISLRRRGDADGTTIEGTDEFFAWAASHAGAAKLVVIIDEIAVLVAALEAAHPNGGAEFLRSLRRPRQERDDVVVMLSGSIGLHHVVSDSSPVNDLQRIYVGPLAHDDAAFLARCLFLGEELEVTDEVAVADAIATQAEGVAYYVHGLVLQAARLGRTVSPDDIAALRDRAIGDPDDPWNLRHYRERIPRYYDTDAPLVHELLDVFATTPGPVPIDAVREQLLMRPDLEVQPSREQLIKVIERLEADHYLVRTGDGDEIALRILRDAWRHLRRL